MYLDYPPPLSRLLSLARPTNSRRRQGVRTNAWRCYMYGTNNLEKTARPPLRVRMILIGERTRVTALDNTTNDRPLPLSHTLLYPPRLRRRTLGSVRAVLKLEVSSHTPTFVVGGFPTHPKYYKTWTPLQRMSGATRHKTTCIRIKNQVTIILHVGTTI